ncbi:MAG: tRNA adenosine(34) deaminase TadA [Chloroflexi bacterium]|nr:tRNA adenosine(34) deaminase TadA [Chloroflexota bacterium]
MGNLDLIGSDGADTAVHETYMRLALKQAQLAADLGEVPVGAVVIWQGQVIGRGHNRKESDLDPTAHAEIIALREAAAFLRNWRLIDATLYCTLEPCPMCAGAMIQARLPQLVYGAKDTRFGADGSIVDVFNAEGFNHRVDITAGILENNAAEMLQTFFRSLREKRSKS